MLIRPPSRIFRNVRKPSPRSPSRFAAGTRAAVEQQLAGRRRVEAQLLLEPADAEARRVGGHDEGADLGAAVVASCPVRAVTMYVPAWPALVMKRLPPSMTHAARRRGPSSMPGGRPRAAGVAAGPGLGQPVRADDLAARHRDEVALLLLGRAGEVERAAAEACAPRRSARASPRRARSPRSRSRRRGCRGRPRPRPRGSGCRASPSRRCGGRPRSGTGARARARRRPARPRSP